jgi:aspartyl-tRNA(Asn)/glutamyl-tRNA(Gln) amidotransferase subunit C
LKAIQEELKSAAWDTRIELTAAETKELLQEIQNFFNLTRQLQAINLKETPATYYGSARSSGLREDLVQPSLPREVSLVNAPDTDGSCFLVPRIIEE